MSDGKQKHMNSFNIYKKSIGFTIVELLVVIVVIGILAAITIVSYSGISRRAIAVALQSDLNAGAKLLELYNVDHGVYPDSLGTNYCPDVPFPDNRYCLKTSDDNELSYTGGGQDYTLTETNTPSGITYEISKGGIAVEVVAGGGGGSGVKTFANAWGGTGFDQIASVINLSDGSFIVAGGTDSFGSGGQDVYIAKYSSEGALIWDKTWGGAAEDDVNSIIKTSDGGFAITGQTKSYGTAGDVYISKYTSDGTLSWTKTWGGAGFEFANSIIQTSDSGYAIVGNTASYGTAGEAFIIKYTSDGTLSWNKTWGGALNDRPESIIQTSDDGYIVAGNTYSFGVVSSDSYIAKYASNGTLSWSKTWGGSGQDKITSMVKMSDDNFVVAGYTSSFGSGGTDLYFAKYTSDGTLSWNKTWGGAGDEYGESIIYTSDGGFAVVGESNSFGAGNDDTYIAKFTSDGNESWSKSWGGGEADVAVSLVQTLDGGYIVGGYTSSFGAGDADSFVARYESNGNMNNCSASKCQTVSVLMTDPSATITAPSATVATPSATVNPQTVSETDPSATTTVIVPVDPYPTATITFAAQEMYIAYPGEDQTVCKEWTVPGGKAIHGFYVSHATESGYDFLTVSLDGTQKYNASGAATNEYVDVSSAPGAVLSACVSADSSTQDGYGGEVTGVYYR